MTLARPPVARLPADLAAFLRFPSVSGDPDHAADVRRCAAWLAGLLRRAGLPVVRVVRTPGHPVVYAEWLGAPNRPTVLVYGHYDVQPADPAGWTTPPFEPSVRGGAVYARGASDDKGPVFAHVAAVASQLRRRRLPVNVKLLFEGEEEVGSPHLPQFVRRHRRRLAADAVVISDTRTAGSGRPAIVYGQRGSLHLDVEVAGPPRDLHAGAFGGSVRNPADVLCRLLAGLHDTAGRVNVPDFYRDIRPPTPTERAALAAAGPREAELLRDAGVPSGWGEPGFTASERTTLRPAVVVSHLGAGAGGGSVVPARATAKVNVRLVPDQDPAAVADAFRRYVAARTPVGVRAVVRVRSATPPVLFDRKHPALRMAAAALRVAFGADPVYLRSGGTIPVARLLRDELGAPVVLMGFSRPDDQMHGPDERFHLADLARGAAAAAGFLRLAAHLPHSCPHSDV
jgi:acetylornithine deacetylase/succinyl-diaminopimelate desuccinylase-like protein